MATRAILAKTFPRLTVRAPSRLCASGTTALRYGPSEVRLSCHAKHYWKVAAGGLQSRTRTITTSVPRNSVVESFPDPDRPELYYHLFMPPTSLSSTTPVFALSFLPTSPPSVLSATVIGWLPASGQGEGAGLNDFVENEHFREVLHDAIKSALRDGADEVQRNGAIQTREGWMHIHDNRNVPALGRIGDPDDILASVRVENGEILADTYQPMPSYRLCTADGVLQLTEGLAERLVELLETRAREEQR